MSGEIREISSDIPNPDEWTLEDVLALAVRDREKGNKGPTAPARETRKQTEEVLEHQN